MDLQPLVSGDSTDRRTARDELDVHLGRGAPLVGAHALVGHASVPREQEQAPTLRGRHGAALDPSHLGYGVLEHTEAPARAREARATSGAGSPNFRRCMSNQGPEGTCGSGAPKAAPSFAELMKSV